MDISGHAKRRLRERLRDYDAEGVFALLWTNGHPATEDEFAYFGTKPLSGREYRVGRRRGISVMVVVDVATDRVVTVLRKGR